MAYAPSRYQDQDLLLKANRKPSAVKDPAIGYAQTALNDLGVTPRLKVDGLFGPKTLAGVTSFQKACGLFSPGLIDQATWDQLDWRVYGAPSWTPAPKTVTNIKPGGPAIVRGCNELLQPPTPVAMNGQTREGQRLSDVTEAFLRRSLGYEGAVKRNQRGTSAPSSHWMGIAGDDMGDQDKDRIVEGHEIVLMKSLWDYLYLRAQGFPAVKAVMRYRLPGASGDVVKATAWRGRDRLRTMVLGNLRFPDGTWTFPGLTRNRDVSWTAVRNSPKAGTGTIHVAPYHLHTDCWIGAPFGSPW